MPSLRRRLALSILLLMATGCVSGRSFMDDSRAAAPRGRGFLEKTTAAGVKYAVFIPYQYDKSKKYPTIVFLHGILEAGDDGIRHVPIGLGRAVKQRASGFPFIVIFPQSTGMWHADREPLVLETLDRTAAEYNVDPDRVYLTGISSGGEGTWIIAADHPDRFAALAPMAAYAATDRVNQLTHIPIWAFHNALDPFVSSNNTVVMVNRINAAGGHAKLSSPTVIQHDCWTAAYDDALFTWFLQQRRHPPTTAP